MEIARDWRSWAALALIAFWIWRVVVTPAEIGLVLFATSAAMTAAALLISAALRRAREEAEA